MNKLVFILVFLGCSSEVQRSEVVARSVLHTSSILRHERFEAFLLFLAGEHIHTQIHVEFVVCARIVLPESPVI